MTEESQPPGSADMAALLAQATDAAAKAHAARQSADDDASYANNAKLAAEGHSKVIAALKGQAESDAGWFTTTRQGVEQAHAVIVRIRAEVEGASQTVTTALAEVEKGRSGVAGVVAEVDEFREAAEKASGEAATHAKQASTQKINAEGFAEGAEAAKKLAETAQEELAELAGTARENAEAVSTLLEEVQAAKKTADGLVESMKAADKKAASVLAIIQTHEQDLARLKGEFDALHQRIESLLPNATSAGLATAFRAQKARFFWPQWLWLATFILTIALLLGFSYWGLPAAGESWDSMWRHFLNRLPLIAPLVWLAIYAGRHYGLALRLQEEYAYKEAVSAAFEGYKREMATVGAGANGGSPLVTLCENVLNTLGQRPGRIYEGKQEDITPAGSAANAVKDVLEVVKDGIKAATGKKPEGAA